MVGPEERIGDGCGGYYLYVLYVYDHVKRDYPHCGTHGLYEVEDFMGSICN